MKSEWVRKLACWATAAACVVECWFAATAAQDQKKPERVASARRAIAERRLAEALETYLQKNKDVLPPKVRADLRKVLDAHRNKGQQTAKILSPRSGDRVEAEIPVEVNVPKKISERGHVWLVVERGNLVWPKQPEVNSSADGQWSGIAYEGGNSGKLDLSLLLVNEASHRRILEWFEQGNRTSSYPGIPLDSLGPDRLKLDTVKDLDFRTDPD